MFILLSGWVGVFIGLTVMLVSGLWRLLMVLLRLAWALVVVGWMALAWMVRVALWPGMIRTVDVLGRMLLSLFRRLRARGVAA